MACREVEMGKQKCECYWGEPGEKKMFGPIEVTTVRTHYTRTHTHTHRHTHTHTEGICSSPCMLLYVAAATIRLTLQLGVSNGTA